MDFVDVNVNARINLLCCFVRKAKGERRKANLFVLILSMCLLIPSSITAQNAISHIEPPNWWTGMQNSSVQLLVHGRDISTWTPLVQYKGLKVSAVHRTENPNYLFIDLQIHPKTKPGTVRIDFLQGRTVMEIHTWELKNRDPNSAARAGFNSSDAIYLITPDRFANGDPSNDDVVSLKDKPDRTDKNKRHGGDIEGVRKHLGYIRDLGFTAIWLNPVLENDMQRSSYHGYSTTNYYKVDPRFGTNESFRQLVQEGNAIGIKHVMDMIPNHCGSEHWWMDDLPAKDWINTWPEFTQSNHRKSVTGDPYASEYDARQFTDGWFVRSMPDLNQRNPFLSKYLIQNAIWWVEYLGLSGIRVDTYPYSDATFMNDYCRSILAEYPNLNIVGEQWHQSVPLVAYWQKGVVNKDGYRSELPCMMDFPLQNAMVRALNTEGTWDDPWLSVYETLAQDGLYADPFNIMLFPDNHDMSRIYTQVNEDYDKYRIAMTLIATMRGIPQVFYGTEILMKNPGTDDHTVIRSDFPGGWDGDKINGFTGLGLTSQEKHAKDFVSDLLKWRKSAAVIHNGKMMHFSPKDGVYVYFRYDEKDKVMVILNKNKEEYRLSLEPYAEMLDGVKTGTDVLTGQLHQMNGEILLDGAGPVILEL